MIRAHNTRYRLERWETPDERTLMGELPVSVRGGHFGVTLVSYIVYQHPHCQVTQPLVLEQLREWGIDISAGQVEAWLSGKHELRDAEEYRRAREGHHQAVARASFAIQAVDS